MSIPGPPEVIACPACGAKHFRETLISGNTCGSRYYSDGRMVAPFLPAFPYFVRCCACKAFFKITEEVISERLQEDSYFRGKSRCDFPFVEFLTIDEFCQAIQDGLHNSRPKGSKEYDNDIWSLRIQLWHTFNDKVRDDKGGAGAIEDPRYIDNCRTMLSEIREEDRVRDEEEEGPDRDTSLLMLAEIHRNLGEFEECMRLLGEIANADKYSRYIPLISEQCAAQNRKTVRINPSEA